MFPLALAGLGIGAVGAIGGIIHNFTSGNQLNALQAQNPNYTQSPYAAQRLGLAQTLLNARMPGASAMERNIQGNQANQLASVNRNATDSSQALALGSAAQGQTNQALQGLSVQEQQDYYNRLQNFTGAQQGMISEGDKAYQDRVRRFQDLASITGAKLQNQQTGWNSLSNLGIGGAGVAAQFGMGAGQSGYRSLQPGAAANSFMGMSPVGTGSANQSYMPGWINPMQNQYAMNTAGYGQNTPVNFPY